VPLSGLRVIDLTRILSGPFCSMLLADLGAEVIKIEPPGRGDPVRGQGAIRNGLSWYFAQFNRNKKSLTLDLCSERGRAILAELLPGADVLVENYRPGVLAALGFDPARLAALSPRLIVASINGFGSTGPYADRPAFDFIAQAMSGFMSMNGPPDGAPMRAAPPLSDLVAGLYAALGIVAALVARGRLGHGQTVEASLTGSLISLFAYLSAEHLATGGLPARTGNDHPIVYPYGLFEAADGQIAIAPSTEQLVRRLLAELDLEALLDQPEFATNAARMAHKAALKPLIEARLRTLPVERWIERLNRAGVPCGRVLSLAEALADPQVQAQEMVLKVEHPGHGPVRMTGFPLKLGATPARIRRPTPALGEHTEMLLGELGYDPAAIAALRADGVV
jgi:crotonobetainyl-CoA:carnitine CoA-transferase CaiB-like acyl-CoA transferase